MVGITNVNAASVGEAYAAIIVTYTAGKVCYISNGSKNLYAHGTSGSEVFFVPESGTWRVYLEGTLKQNVSITYEGQSVSVSVS